MVTTLGISCAAAKNSGACSYGNENARAESCDIEERAFEVEGRAVIERFWGSGMFCAEGAV
jgi:hypothetical protein